MAIKDLREFVDLLKERDLLTVIDAEVDPVLEITQIADVVSKSYLNKYLEESTAQRVINNKKNTNSQGNIISDGVNPFQYKDLKVLLRGRAGEPDYGSGGKALLFTNVKGSKFPLLINALGSYERMYLGLGVSSFEEIANQIQDYMKLSQYATLGGKIKAIPKLMPLPFIFPKKVKKAACQEVISEPNLDLLPIIKCWPEDGGKYLTLPLVFTKDPESGQQNVGMYRLQVYDHKTTGMHWHLHKDGKEIYEKYRKLGRRMPVSVALGCDPASIYSATAPLPKMIDEMVFAGYLRKKSRASR